MGKTAVIEVARRLILVSLLASAPAFAIPIGSNTSSSQGGISMRLYTHQVVSGMSSFASWFGHLNPPATPPAGHCNACGPGQDFVQSIANNPTLTPPPPPPPTPTQSPPQEEPLPPSEDTVPPADFPPTDLPHCEVPVDEPEIPVPPNAVPEPGSLVLLALGLTALRARRRR